MESYSLLRVVGEGSFGRALLVRRASGQEKHVVKEIRLPKVRACVQGLLLVQINLHLCGGA